MSVHYTVMFFKRYSRDYQLIKVDKVVKKKLYWICFVPDCIQSQIWMHRATSVYFSKNFLCTALNIFSIYPLLALQKYIYGFCKKMKKDHVNHNFKYASMSTPGSSER